MRRNRAQRWVMAGAAVGAVVLLAGCGGKDVTFTPAAAGSAVIPADGYGSASPTSSSDGAAPAPSGAPTLPPNIVVSTQGSTICVRNKDTGSQACVGNRGTAVVNGIVIVDGKVVATGSSNGGSVVVNGGSVVSGDNVPPVATSGTVTLGGAVQWRGSAKGTCQRQGDVRHVKVDLANGGKLGINAVGDGVLQLELATGGNTYSGNWVGATGAVQLGDKSLTLTNAQVGRGANTVRVSATLDC